MRTTQIITITAVRRKKSVRENVYAEFDFEETPKDTDHEFDMPVQCWTGVYHPHDIGKEAAETLAGKKVTAILSFYPEKRRNGEKVYTDIKMLLSSFEVLKEAEEKGSN